MAQRSLQSVLVGFILPVAFLAYSQAEEQLSPNNLTVSYSQQVAPILRAKCQGCHQPAKAQGSYELTTFSGLFSAGDSGNPAIVSGQPDASELVRQIVPVDGSAAMPKESAPLSETEIDLIRNWIAQGAVNDTSDLGSTINPQHPPTYSRPPVITSLAYSPDGNYLASSGFHEAFLINAAKPQTVARLVGLSERVQSVVFSPDSSKLAVTGGSPGRFGEIQIWNVGLGELEISHQVTFDTLFGGAFSKDGKLFAFGATDRVVRAIDPETGLQKLQQGAHEDWSLATVFNPTGTHLVSGGRDMTVKLTEVATERFVDNVTSITPGALKGGVSALAMHTVLDQVLVGGADGVPKIYRIFRETERKIGDDANLVRAFPQMPGRIFGLSISRDGRLFAVVATLDGKSRLRVFPFDFVGEMPDEVKAVNSKAVDQRSDDEKRLIQQFLAQTSPAVIDLEVNDSLYSVSIDPSGKTVATGGAGGVVRIYSIADSQLLHEFVPVEVREQPKTAESTIVASDNLAAESLVGTSSSSKRLGSGLAIVASALPTKEEETRLLPDSELQRIEVHPKEAQICEESDYVQFVVSATYADGKVVDVTRLASFAAHDQPIQVDQYGQVRYQEFLKNSQSFEGGLVGQLEIGFQGQTVQVPIAIQAVAADSTADSIVDFVRDVNPILTRLGCNAGTCHGAQQGKNGFQLSLRGYDPLGDVRALSDDLSARRLNPAAPDSSLMLLKPLGKVPHVGGTLFSKDSSYYHTLRKWIEQGAGLNLESRKVERIEIFPPGPILEREGAWQQFQVTAYYPDGSQRDVTHETFIESSNTEVCESMPGGRVRGLRRGEAAVLARYEGSYAAASLTVMGDRTGFRWQATEAYNTIDRLVAQKWERMKILPAEISEDHVFLRRVRLDLTGLPPSLEELKSFLGDSRPSRIKRQQKIDELIGSNDYVEHWTNKWADLLQVNSKYLGQEGAAAFRQWIRSAIAENRPYDQFVRDIITASGSNKDNPAASYYKILRDPDLLVENTTHLFLAVRFNCNKCHDHPFERWTQDQYYQLAAYFAQTGLQTDPASGDKVIGGTAVEGAKPLYEQVVDRGSGEMKHGRTGQVVAPKFPFECQHESSESGTRRESLAAWLTSHDNAYFATSLVNRLWGYLTGTGLIEPLDDIRAGNPPSNPELLEHLEKEFLRSNFNVQHILRLICNSRTYQLSVAKNRWNEDDSLNYSAAKARRLPAEVLYDSVYRVTGTQSAIPGASPGMRAAELPDVAINPTDGFLNNLGRPVRESACECERSDDLQLGPVMALVSGPTVGTAIGDASNQLVSIARQEISNRSMIEEIYLRVLNRHPSQQETEAVLKLESEMLSDHQSLQSALNEKEQWWKATLPQLDQQRLAQLEKIKNLAVNRAQEIAPERARLETERQSAIEAARKALTEYEQNPLFIVDNYLNSAGPSNHWFPLAAISAESSNQAQLIPQSDRSIIASGDATPASYTIRYKTPLRNIRGLRLETLPMENVPGSGPGLSSSGNFVISEIQVHSAPIKPPVEGKSEPVLRTIVSAKASFTQAGFNPNEVFDTKIRGQGGWAIAPRAGIVQWVTFGLAEPIDHEGGTELSFTIHQNHDAADHRLGRFRISVTTDEGEIYLGLPEEFSASAAIAEKNRKAEHLQSLIAYLDKSDGHWLELRSALSTAELPVAPDETLTAMEKEIAELEKPIVDDPRLVQLRADFAASSDQMADQRLTLAQDLTWALINSPAFLFNH